MIIRATENDLPCAAALARELWPGHTQAELEKELAPLARGEGGALFLLCLEGQPCGFAQCQLRHDYVEGTSSSPVGYLEGLYVRPGQRGKGWGRALVRRCEDWARGEGCLEFASDCGLDNAGSLAFHLKAGFSEAGRIICFAKRL